MEAFSLHNYALLNNKSYAIQLFYAKRNCNKL